MSNLVGLQTDVVGHVGQNSSAHVASIVGLETDAVVVTETGLFGVPFEAADYIRSKGRIGKAVE